MKLARDLLGNFDHSVIPNSASTIIVFNAHDDLHELIWNYLLGLLNARIGNPKNALQFANKLVQLPGSPGTLAADLALSVQAQNSIAEGRPLEALEFLELTRTHTWYGQTMVSPYFSQAYERFTKAELLFELGRYNEALEWYEHLTQISPFELIYLPISHMRRGEIYERLGDIEKAKSHYSQFIELWKNCDPEFRSMVDVAEKQLNTLGMSR